MPHRPHIILGTLPRPATPRMTPRKRAAQGDGAGARRFGPGLAGAHPKDSVLGTTADTDGNPRSKLPVQVGSPRPRSRIPTSPVRRGNILATIQNDPARRVANPRRIANQPLRRRDVLRHEMLEALQASGFALPPAA